MRLEYFLRVSYSLNMIDTRSSEAPYYSLPNLHGEHRFCLGVQPFHFESLAAAAFCFASKNFFSQEETEVAWTIRSHWSKGLVLFLTLLFRKQFSVRFWRLRRTFPLDEVRPGLPLLRYIQKVHESGSVRPDTQYPEIYLPKTSKIHDFGRFFEMGALHIDPPTSVPRN